LSSDQSLPADCATILSPDQTLLADCGATLSSVQTLPAAFRTTLPPVFFLNYTKMERKKPTFSLPQPYFQPYFLNKTTLVARKAPRLTKPY
jgi:hypothetical protein